MQFTHLHGLRKYVNTRIWHNSGTVSRISILKAILESLHHFINTLFHGLWWLKAYSESYFLNFQCVLPILWARCHSFKLTLELWCKQLFCPKYVKEPLQNFVLGYVNFCPFFWIITPPYLCYLTVKLERWWDLSDVLVNSDVLVMNENIFF